MRYRSTGLALACLLVACASPPAVDANDTARRAYLGLDKSLAKTLQAGFDAYNTAASASLPGDTSGTLVVGGEVDKTSPNRTMRLYIGMTSYSDGGITYSTSATQASQPYLSLMLMNLPNGTVTGTLTGDYTMTGEVKGTVTLNLMISGSVTMSGTDVVRVIGSTTITGTASDSNGTYDINVMI